MLSTVKYLAFCAMLEIKNDILEGKLSAKDENTLLDSLIKKLIERRMTKKDGFGKREKILYIEVF